MDSQARRRQIDQITSFMRLEAREKAEEIALKTQQDAALEQQTTVVAAKRKLAVEFARRRKALEAEARIVQSKELAKHRGRHLVVRDGLMQELRKEAVQRLEAFTKSPQYADLLVGLIVQGAKSLSDNSISVRGREQDLAILEKAAVAATSRLDDGVSVTVDKVRTVPDSCIGGVELSSMSGKIVLHNSLEARLSLALHQLEPVLRHVLFPSGSKPPPSSSSGGASSAPAASAAVPEPASMAPPAAPTSAAAQQPMDLLS